MRPFKKWICFCPLWGRLWGVFNTPHRPGTCDSSKYRYNSPTGYVWPFKKMDLFSSPSGPRGRAYSIRPYDRVRAILQNTDIIPQPDTYGPSKKWICFRPLRGRGVGRIQYAPTTGYVLPFEKLSRFRPLRGRLWGVFNTPLRLGTCNPSKYRCYSPTGYVWPFKKWVCFRPLRGRLWGVFNTPLQPATCNSSKY